MPIPLVSTLAALALCACATTHSDDGSPTVTDHNKTTVRALYEDCLNRGELGLLDTLVAPDYVGPTGERGPAGLASVFAGLRAGFPDIQFTIETLLGDGDQVSVRWRWQGHHRGTFRGYAPTDKHVTNEGVAFYTLADGKVRSGWVITDRLGILQQLGVVP